MPNTPPSPQSRLIDQLRAAVREFNQFLPKLNATEQEYDERYIPVSPEAEIDERAWAAASREDIEEKLADIKKRHEANERIVARVDNVLASRRRKAEDGDGEREQQAVVDEIRRLSVGSATKQDGR